MHKLPLTGKRLLTIAAVAAAVIVGLLAGLLGSAATSSAFDHAGGTSLPSPRRLRSAAAALARAPRSSPETTLVAQARGRTIALYHRPDTRSYRTLGPLPYSYGTRPIFRVLTSRGAWLRVSLPVRPNHSSAWVHRRSIDLARTNYRIAVRLRTHRLLVWRGRRLTLSTPIAVGKALTPTPSGIYFIAYALRTTDPTSFFGPYAFGLSAYSNVLTSFAGGDGEVGLHGTNEPWLLGTSVSHGCIRIRNSVIARLAQLLPLGTPVQIQR